jgi:DNA repair protein RadC
MPIKLWPETERPREKLIRQGAEQLTPAELIGILIGNGTGSRSAVEIGKDLLGIFSGLEELAHASVAELTAVVGIGNAKAVLLKAAFELSRKMHQEIAEQKCRFFRSPGDVADVFIARLGHLKQEVFAIALLDSANRYMGSHLVTVGTLNSAPVHPREVFVFAVKNAAAHIILIHNHPSGQLKPSKEDLQITNQLVGAGKILDIPVTDHLIVTREGYLSLREEGFITG